MQQPVNAPNMKKIYIYILVIIILTAILHTVHKPDTAAAADATTYTNAVDELLAGVKGKKKSFTGENLYLEVYKTSTGKASENTTKNVSDKYGISQENVDNIVKKGDLKTLVESDKNATLEQLQMKYMKITSDYKATMETENMRTTLESKVTPSEIYADGDTSNSDFDLLYDLNLVEAILFNKTTPSSFTNKFQAPVIKIITDEDLKALQNLFKDQEQREAEETREALIEAQGGQTAAAPGASEIKGTNPLSCLQEDDVLTNALSDFDEQKTEEEAAAADADEEGQETGTVTEVIVPNGPITSENLPQAPSDDWKSTTLCDEGKVFCITIDFEMKLAELGNYPKEANCIACHIQKINEELDKIIKKPTSPNKVTGNFMEMPKCKTSFTNIASSMNIITKAVPPPLQKKTDAFHTINVETEWKKINQTYTAPQAAGGTATRKALMDAPADATLDDVQKRITQISSTIEKQQQQTVETTQKTDNTETQNTKFQLLINEINTMHGYFKSIKDSFEKLKKPCEELATKATCS
jgi:cell pole-organizing protein PopZ